MSPHLKAVPSGTQADTHPGTQPTIQWHEWEGGRYRVLDDGKTRAYYIRRSVPGHKRFEFSLGPMTEAKAMGELTLFEEAVKAGNPYTYKPPQKRTVAPQTSAQAVPLNAFTFAEFIKWARAQADVGALSETYVEYSLGKYLTWWMAKLGGKDLHTVTLDELRDILKTEDTALHKRVVALKTFTKWARMEKSSPKLQRAKDATLDLVTPKVIAEKARRKKGYTIPQVEALYRAMPNEYIRAMIRLRIGAHGMHDTEIDRLARGEGELTVIDDPSGIYGTLAVKHKSTMKTGRWHVVSVDKATFQAAELLRSRGRAMSNTTVLWAFRDYAREKHGCEGVRKRFGNRAGARANEAVWRTYPCPRCERYVMTELRHSFATWARNVGKEVKPKNHGVAPEIIAEVMGHGANVSTTKNFYIGDYVPSMIRIPIKLQHPDDRKED